MSDKCDQEVFQNGHAICLIDGRSVDVEPWVQSVAAESGQRVDWHYSGGIANVLYLGDHAKVREAAERLAPTLEGRIMRWYEPETHGIYRAGDAVPAGTIAISPLDGVVFLDGEQDT